MLFIEAVLLLYFVYFVGYTFVFSIAGLFYRSPVVSRANKYATFCVLIPSYKSDDVVLDSAKRSLTQSYPSQFHDIFVVADSLQPATVEELRKYVGVIEVSFPESTKVKSLNAALASLTRSYDYTIILDADNVMQPDLLAQLNDLFATGRWQCIQGQRKPKNDHTTLAFLDGLSEAINNHIYRRGQVVLGCSASIAGSGVGFRSDLLRKHLSSMDSVGGFDRDLEVRLLQDGYPVFYLSEAIVLDEKVSKSEAFQNQRKRWISSQYFYLRKYWKDGVGALLRGNFSLFNSTILRNIQLPRLINLGLLSVITTLLFLVRNQLYFGWTIWGALFLLTTLSILLAIPRAFYSKKFLIALLSLPRVFIQMFALLFRLKHANKTFIHTPHELQRMGKSN